MKRRLLCVLLSALILLILLPAAAMPVLAAEDMTTSDACVDILKDMEGFVEYPMYDNGQYTVGYGSGCGKNDYPNGITEEEAEELLREHLAGMEKSINYFANRYNLTFTQSQFDALMLFTYNCGANWVTSDGEFRQAVINGAKGNDFIYPFTLWSNASGKLNVNLVKRRLIEADMYLNGSYSNKCPVNYTYVVFDNNGGISDVKVQGYDSNQATLVKPVPTLSGYRFLGWYTAEEGGSWVTSLTASNGGKTLYAHWQQGSGDAVNGTPASYQRTTGQLGSLSVYNAPGGTATDSLTAGSAVKIVADYVDGSNVKWGKLENGSWVNLGSALVGIVSGEAQTAVNVTVTNSYINVRSGPGTTNAKVGMVNLGDQLTITETMLVGTDLWGKFSGGWISLMYTNYDAVVNAGDTETEEDSAVVIATGTVVNCNTLRIRSNAGLNYPVVGSLVLGTQVQITQEKTANGMTWGKIANGWISLTYVKLDETSSEPEQEKPAETPDTSGKVTGTVISNIPLNIRSAPGAHNARVGTYARGTKLEILEQKDYNGAAWGRTDKGWVCMQYVQLDAASSGGSSGTGVSGTVISNSPLNIRTDAGVYNTQIGTYAPGTQITVFEQKTVVGQQWGRTDRGWVCLDYVSLNGTVPEASTKPEVEEQPETETQPETGTGTESESGSTGNTTPSVNGTVVSYSPLNIRSAPGSYNTQIGTYTRGTRITILEQAVVNEQSWGRTDRGWVCMAYVQLDSEGDSSGYSGTVNTNNLRIRSAAGTTNTILGYYNTGDKVTILETVYLNGVAWGRTNKGWICLIYVDK